MNDICFWICMAVILAGIIYCCFDVSENESEQENNNEKNLPK